MSSRQDRVRNDNRMPARPMSAIRNAKSAAPRRRSAPCHQRVARARFTARSLCDRGQRINGATFAARARESVAFARATRSMRNPPATISSTLRAVVTRVLHPRFFFANDGVSNDPIYPFLREYAWHGIVVEPLAPMLDELRRNYRDFPGIVLEHAAIAATPRPFHYLPASAGYERTWTKQVGTLNPGALAQTIDRMRTYEFDGPVPADLERSVATVEVPCLTFEALMAKHRVEQVDFLSIDAESADYEIFCSIDLDRWRPTILCIETGDMSEHERADFERRVRAAGYVFLEPFDFLTGVYVQRAAAPRWHAVTRLRRRVGARLRGALQPQGELVKKAPR